MPDAGDFTLIEHLPFIGSYSGTTDSAGLLTVSHGAPFTPSAVIAITSNPGSSFAGFWGADEITSTQVRLRFQNIASTGGLASGNVSGVLVCLP